MSAKINILPTVPVAKEDPQTAVIEAESKELNQVDDALAHEETANDSQVAEPVQETVTELKESDASEDTSNDTIEDTIHQILNTPSDAEVPVETTTVKSRMHVVKYIGNGIWKDRNDVSWALNHSNKNIITTANFTDDEYVTRTDLHFMVKYGSMEHTLVEF